MITLDRAVLEGLPVEDRLHHRHVFAVHAVVARADAGAALRARGWDEIELEVVNRPLRRPTIVSNRSVRISCAWSSSVPARQEV